MVSKPGNTRTLIGVGVAVALVALVSAALVFAQTVTPPADPAGPGMRGWRPMARMMGLMGQGPMGGMRGRGPMGPMMGRGGLMGVGIPLGQLGLTDAQKDQIKKILESHKAEAQSLRQEAAGSAHEALRTAIESNDANAIQTASTNLASEIAKGATLAAKVRAEVLGVLTDEQKAKAKELRAQAERRRPRFQGMHLGPPLF